MNGLVSCPRRMPHGRPLRGCGRQDGLPATVHCTLGSATTTSRAQAGCCRARRRRWIRRACSPPSVRESLPLLDRMPALARRTPLTPTLAVFETFTMEKEPRQYRDSSSGQMRTREYNVRSCEGCAQGGPLGPFLFAIGYHWTLLEMQVRNPSALILANRPPLS